MKKENLLNKAEMKKVTGGDPPTVWLCIDPIYQTATCYPNHSTCTSFCSWGTCERGGYGSCD